MENESAAIEDDGIDFFGQQSLGDRFPRVIPAVAVGCARCGWLAYDALAALGLVEQAQRLGREVPK